MYEQLAKNTVYIDIRKNLHAISVNQNEIQSFQKNDSKNWCRVMILDGIPFEHEPD